jgi:multidrug efflux pump subunit AcrA (membrane-fusion protein)
MKRSRNIAILLIAAILVAGIALFARRASTPDPQIPVALVTRGDLDLKVYATGELDATHTMTLSAPAIGGGALHVIRLWHAGAPVKKGDIVIEFDPSEQRYKLEQSRSELLEADQEIAKAEADAAVLAAQDKVALLKARYAVRRAELDVQQNELKSSIEARKSTLAFDEAKRALTQLDEDIKSHAVNGRATITVAREKHNKARLAMDQAQQNIDRMRVRSPIDGLVAINKNTQASGIFMGQGISLPDFREGDEVRPGTGIAEVIDPGQMELKATIGEHERNTVRSGQKADIRLDAQPERMIAGTVKTAGGASDISITLAEPDPRIRPGMSAQVLIYGDKQTGVLSIPRQAIFLKGGKRTVYVAQGSGFTQKEVEIRGETESRAAIEGLNEGASVAMVDPTVARKSSGSGSEAAAAGGGTP